MIDTLTKIPSFNAFLKAIKNTDNPKLFLIDLKDFKQINIKHTDEAGNFVLKKFALALEKFAKQSEMNAFRMEEDEFALIKDMPFDLEKIEELLYTISDFIETQKYNYKDNEIAIEAHIGICLDQSNLLEKAKKALKIGQRKDIPFITYSGFVTSLLDEDTENTCNLLRNAIEDSTITPYYQRALDLEGKVLYHEVLIRIVSENGTISPKIFLDIAKENGFYVEIIKHIIEKIKPIKGIKALNVSNCELFNDELYSLYTNSFEENSMIFEIQNEECLNNEKLPQKIKELKNKKIKICIDNVDNIDFIKNQEADFVKIKRNLIRHLNIDPQAVATCKEIIATCKAKNIKTIATHINSNNSFEEAKKLGFDYYQGFFFGELSSNFL